MEILKSWCTNDDYFIKTKDTGCNKFWVWKYGYFQRIKYTDYQTWDYILFPEYITKQHHMFADMYCLVDDFIYKREVILENWY